MLRDKPALYFPVKVAHPPVREYMDQEKWKEADAQVPVVGQVLENVAVAIGNAADHLEKAMEQGQ